MKGKQAVHEISQTSIIIKNERSALFIADFFNRIKVIKFSILVVCKCGYVPRFSFNLNKYKRVRSISIGLHIDFDITTIIAAII